MKRLCCPFLLSLLLVISTAIPSIAKTVTLAWDQNNDPGVTGYKIYYKANTPTFPFNGTNLSVGASPIAVNGSGNTSLSFVLPDDGNMYYFTATTVINDIESDFSEIVASEWFPALLAPMNNARRIATVANFVWSQPPPANFKPGTSIVSFQLLYGTDSNLDINATAPTSPGSFNSTLPPLNSSFALILVIMMSTFLFIKAGRTKRIWNPIRASFCIGIFVLQASCGGGGGDDNSISSISDASVPSSSVPSSSVPSSSVPDTGTQDTAAPVPAALFTNVITDIKTTEYQITDLQPNTQYYWKIVAVDNWGITYESITQKFTTVNY